MQSNECISVFQINLELQSLYLYHGEIGELQTGSDVLITKTGCKAVSGTAPQLYDWDDSSSAVCTWVLPMLGMLLSVSFVSNEFRHTIFAAFRWMGSPVLAMTHIL
jgi:hypothetical protein